MSRPRWLPRALLSAAIAFLPRLIRRWRKGSTGWVEPEELRRRMAMHRATAILDVRNADEFDGPLGHIPGALNIPLAELERRLGELRRLEAGAITVACRTDRRSVKAAESLAAAGFLDVAVLRGGMERWNREGLPAERREQISQRSQHAG